MIQCDETTKKGLAADHVRCDNPAKWKVTTEYNIEHRKPVANVCDIHRRQLERLAKLNDKTFKQEPL